MFFLPLMVPGFSRPGVAHSTVHMTEAQKFPPEERMIPHNGGSVIVSAFANSPETRQV